MALQSPLVKGATPEVFELDPQKSLPHPKKLPSGVWIYRVAIMVQKCLHWETAEMFIDSRKLMILQNIPPSAKCLRRLSLRRVVLCAVNFNGKPGSHVVAQLRVDDPQKQMELQRYLKDFRTSAPHYHSGMSF